MSFATPKKRKDEWDAVSALESGPLASNDVEAVVERLRTGIQQQMLRVSNITKAEKNLGTERDSATARELVDGYLQDCERIHRLLMQGESYLRGLIGTTGDGGTGKLNLVTIDRLSEQIQNAQKAYVDVHRSYEAKKMSRSVQEKYELFQRERENLKNLETDKTPLLSGKHNNAIYLDTPHREGQMQMQVKVQTPEQVRNDEISESTLQLHADLIQQRDNAITSISKGVQDINKMFKDLDAIVNQQGEQIDSIENNMMSIANNNQLATRELVKAEDYQRRKGKCTCILLLVLVVILIIVLLVLS